MEGVWFMGCSEKSLVAGDGRYLFHFSNEGVYLSNEDMYNPGVLHTVIVVLLQEILAGDPLH